MLRRIVSRWRNQREARRAALRALLFTLFTCFGAVVATRGCIVAQSASSNDRPLTNLLDTVDRVSPDSTSLLAGDDLFAVVTDDRIIRRNIVSGHNEWSVRGATPFSDMVVGSGRLYVTGPNGFVFARSLKSGALLWSSGTHDAGNLRLSMTRGMLFLRGNAVTRLNPKNGALLWQTQTGRVENLIAPASIFVSIADGDPIQERIEVLNPNSGTHYRLRSRNARWHSANS